MKAIVSKVIANSTGGISLDAARKLPTYKASQRGQSRAYGRKPNPTTVAEINIPDVLRTTQRNVNFKMWDSGHPAFLINWSKHKSVSQKNPDIGQVPNAIQYR